MKKGDFTKELIITKAAELFNKLGFAGASLLDLMKATGFSRMYILRLSILNPIENTCRNRNKPKVVFPLSYMVYMPRSIDPVESHQFDLNNLITNHKKITLSQSCHKTS